MIINFELSAADALALSLVAADVQEWVHNAATARAAAAMAEIRVTDGFQAAMADAARGGLDLTDTAAIIKSGISLGLIETAASRSGAAVTP